VILRPTAEDCDGPANLAAKVAALRKLGVPGVEFYHYGLMRLSSLDRVGAALHGVPPMGAILHNQPIGRIK